MVVSLLLLLGGLAMLVVGAEALVRGASNLARAIGISELLIGLTIVAFGTSAPELSVNLMAALNGAGDVSFGNIIGSNIANIGIILGVSACVRPLAVHALVIRREIPMMALSAGLMIALSIDDLLGAGPSMLDREDAIALLLLFCVFLYYSAGDALKQRSVAINGGSEKGVAEISTEPVIPPRPKSVLLNVLLVIAGLVALFIGGRITVTNAVELAQMAGVPDVFIALTVVAVGTSLPELATSLVAAYRGQTDIAIGNVVGSNIFNILFILGVSASITPIATPVGGYFDLAAMMFLSVILLPLTMTDRGRLVRWEGIVLLTMYVVYVVWRYLAYP